MTRPLGYALGVGVVLLGSMACEEVRREVERAQKARDTVATDTGLAVTLVTDKAGYAPGEPIVMTLTLMNPSADPAFLSFRTGQRYDFALVDAQGRAVWRWSADQLFTQALGAERVWPGRSLTYRERYEGPLAPGVYRLTGRIVAVGRELSDTAEITVGPE